MSAGHGPRASPASAVAPAAAQAADPAPACGTDDDCAVRERTYRVALPAEPDGRAIVFFHGVGGSATGRLANPAMRAPVDELGVTLLAAQSAAEEWNIPGAPSEYAAGAMDELAHFDALMADAGARFGVDPDRTLAAGFSAGATVTWTLACFRGDAAAGFAPMSGTFWRPLPQDCATGAVDLVHHHGTGDATVPMEGRAVMGSRQGSVDGASDLMARTGAHGPARTRPAPGLDCSRRPDDEGRVLEPCLFGGGHVLDPDHLRDAWTALGMDDG